MKALRAFTGEWSGVHLAVADMHLAADMHLSADVYLAVELRL